MTPLSGRPRCSRAASRTSSRHPLSVAHPRHEVFAGHTVARTTSFDEAHDAVCRVYLPHRLDLRGHDPCLDMRLNAVQLGNITAGHLRYGRDVRIVTAEAAHCHVDIPLVGATDSRSGGRDVGQSSTRCAGVFMPGAPAAIRWHADCEQLCLMIDRDQLERELETMLGRPIPGPVEFVTTMNLAGNGGRRWLESVALFKREFEGPPVLSQHPLAARTLERLLIDGLLLVQPHNHTDALTQWQRPAPSRAVREAIDLMEAHPEQPWSTSGLARNASVSARTARRLPACGRHAADGVPAGDPAQARACGALRRGAGFNVRDGGRHQVGIRASEPIRLGVPGEVRPDEAGDAARAMITARRFRTGRGHPPRQGG
jgi:hypothetical protein